MYAIAYQCGLRRGELLKIRLDDVPKLKDVGLKVRRRPNDKSDTRRYKPSVKTAEPAITISDEVRVGLRAYLSSRPPIGCVSGRTPYLFVSSNGPPLSITAADGITKVISVHAEIPDLSWHSLRHTWAESLAGDLLEKYPDEQTLAFLRELGG
jgi:integrase